MKKYIVGGYVRDYLISKYHHKPFKPNDKDYVAVGYTVEDMLQLGYKQVGKEFPVFLNDKGEEIALARTEKKKGNSHNDFICSFSPNVTLYEDCQRRNHTINSMYMDEETGEIIDYVNGIEDIKNKIIRHTSGHFQEDPLRILIAFRQSTQLDFEIAVDTKQLLKQMVSNGMLEHLTPERVWKETEKALTNGYNSRKYFEGLNEVGALEILFPELFKLTTTPERVEFHPSGNSFKHTMIALDRVRYFSPLVKFSVLCHDLGKGTTPEDILPKHIGHEDRGGPLIDAICDRLKAPNDYRKLALTCCKYHMRFIRMREMRLRKRYDYVRLISDNFTNGEQLFNLLNCFYGDWYGEEVSRPQKDDDLFLSIKDEIISIFNIMNGIGLKDLSEKDKEKLSKLKGEKFGEVYNEAKFRYFEKKLKESI